jgi:Fur family transcriptional regulator, ferric uptake regulator
MRQQAKKGYNTARFSKTNSQTVLLAAQQEITVETHDLRNAGLKVTLPRVKILQILENQATDRHLTAEQVYKILLSEDEEIGLATVYRVLTQFEAAGLVTRHHFEGGNSVFELSDGDHHDHILCIKCGKVDEFTDDIIEVRQKEIALRLGYELTAHGLYLYGFCPKCKKS